MSGNEEKEIPLLQEEVRQLRLAIADLNLAIGHLRMANDFQELASGYGAETYGETIEKLRDGIRDYLRRNLVER